MGKRNAVSIEDVSAPGGDFDLPHVLILRQLTQPLSFVHLQDEGAAENGGEQPPEEHGQKNHSDANPTRRRLVTG